MSKKLTLLFLLTFFSFNLYAEENYVPGISDLPVPANFFYIDDSSGIFNNGYGRFINANFRGKSKLETIYDFYEKTLPALGWDAKEKFTYVRDEEILEIKISQINEDEVQLNFQLSPKQ
jgi:hypothetical protein